MQAGGFGLDPTRDWVAVRARAADPTAVERALRLTGPDPLGAGTSIDGDLAALLAARPADVPGAVIGVGPALPLHRAAESFRLAGRALVTAASFGLTGCHDVPGLGLRAAVVADGDVGEGLRTKYLTPLREADPHGDLLAGLRAWFECGLHVERAAERLFVHPNTLRARLAKVEALTGADLRDRVTTFELWWALERDALAGNGADSTESAATRDPAP